jgi:hypothetical protein
MVPVPIPVPAIPQAAPKASPQQGPSQPPPAPKAEAGPPPPPATWPEPEIVAALSDCLKEVSGKNIVFEALKPIREGSCGLPAPILLKSFTSDKGPVLTISPPATTTCRMASALRRWIDDVVQPSAKRNLDAAIVTLSNASAYACRNQNSSPLGRLSQHATGNALDVATFVTAKGETVSVLDHWTLDDGRGRFLREVHAGACAIFGTTLGPEANADHKNHFHLDMTPRRQGLCDFTPDQAARRDAKRKEQLVLARQRTRRLQFGLVKRRATRQNTAAYRLP